MSRIKKAVIPAAGLGTRFYPLTRAQPKEMLPLVDRPVIHYVVEEAIKSGLDEILIIVGAGKDAIINYFDGNQLDETHNNEIFASMPDIYFVRQKHQLGLADSLRYAEKFVDGEPFVVLLGDTVYTSNSDLTVTRQMIDIYNRRNKPIIALEQVPKELTRNYGIVEAETQSDGTFLVKDMVEKPNPEDAPSNLGITGLYALESNIFDYIRRTTPGKNNELQLTDALSLLAHETPVFGFEISGSRYDIGSIDLWIKSFLEFIKRDERYRKYL